MSIRADAPHVAGVRLKSDIEGAVERPMMLGLVPVFMPSSQFLLPADPIVIRQRNNRICRDSFVAYEREPIKIAVL
jgi:hypothetical protein